MVPCRQSLSHRQATKRDVWFDRLIHVCAVTSTIPFKKSSTGVWPWDTTRFHGSSREGTSLVVSSSLESHTFVRSGHCINCSSSNREWCCLSTACPKIEFASLWFSRPGNTSHQILNSWSSLGQRDPSLVFLSEHLYDSYTLGGFYLARYKDSPVGAFDEATTLNRSLPCPSYLWLSACGHEWSGLESTHLLCLGRSSLCQQQVTPFIHLSLFSPCIYREARDHGLNQIGLPSRLAQFATTSSQNPSTRSWWRPASEDTPMASLNVKNVERRGWFSKGRGLKSSVCTFLMDHNRFKDAPKGPRIKISLPSFRHGVVLVGKM